MAILESCCLWNDVRKGSFASIIYTLIYFSFSCYVMFNYLIEENAYISGQSKKPNGESFLEMGDVSQATVVLSAIFVFCSTVGVVTSTIAYFGLKLDKKNYLLPWIIFMIIDISIELLNFFYWVFIKTLVFDVLIGMIFTIDFFIVCLNIYCVVCVTSQYQEYRDGRGFARHRFNVTNANINNRLVVINLQD